MTNSQIFTAAWNAAREGAARFGGSVRSYFAAALRAAYAAARKPAPRTLTVFDKIDALGHELWIGASIRKGTFAHRFISDNTDRYARFGKKTRFSDKQAAVIDNLFAQFCA